MRWLFKNQGWDAFEGHSCQTHSKISLQSCKADTDVYFDTALIVHNCNHYQEMGGPYGKFTQSLYKCKLMCYLFAGLHVVQIWVIFMLPTQYGTYSHPLAYIKWFWPFSVIDKTISMYKAMWSTCNQTRHTAIIRVNKILQPCYLVSKYGSTPVDTS